MPLSKPYKNKPDYDPGLLREKISFLQTSTTKNEYGGVSVSQSTIFETKAFVKPVRDGGQVEIELGATNLNGDRYFIIRSISSFAPDKSMQILHEGKKFKIVKLGLEGQPQKYWKILGIKTE